jgi:hypothetical protein
VSRLLALVLLGLALTSCGASPPALQDVAGGATTSTSVAPPVEAPDPTAVTIPKIGARSSLVPLGLTERGELDVPPVDQPGQASWYAGADVAFDGDEYDPGEVGPAVLAGHVDGIGPDGRKGHPGVFHRLPELVPGDTILIDRKDGSQLTFVVTATAEYDKSSFDAEAVYGPTTVPALRLITCSGPFDRSSGHYLRNTVVFAELAEGATT